MANGTPTTVEDIIKAQETALGVVDAQIKVTSNLQSGGSSDAKIDAALKKLRAKRTEIYDQSGDNILASADLAAALKVMKNATDDMNKIAPDMKTEEGVFTNLSKFLGFGTQIADALKSVSSSPKPGSAPSAGSTAKT